MPRHLESNDSANLAQPQMISPDRPPQLKWENCRYRCGWGCEKPDEDEGHSEESDNESGTTRIGTPSILDFGDVGNDEGYQASANFDGGEPTVIVVVNGSSSSHVSQSESAWENHSAVAYSTPEYNDMSDSLDPEPCATGDQSEVSSSSRSAGTRSPDPGITYWTRGLLVCQPSPPYFFRVMPLRLSPQCEHCRGHPAWPHDGSR